MVELVDKNTFQSVIEGNQIVVADFFAVWCGPCKMMHPIFEELAQKHTNIKFVRIDIDQSENLAIDQNVQVVPTFIAYKNAKEIGRLIGYNSVIDFERFLNKL